jgi:phosphoglycolate phosphatase-like HAD superfamily hydrolase
MTRIEGVLFDLDGTLLDSAPDLVGSLNWVRKGEDLPPVTVSELSKYVSKGAVGLLKAGMPETSAEQFETWRTIFLEHYADNSFHHSRLYDGVPELPRSGLQRRFCRCYVPDMSRRQPGKLQHLPRKIERT